MSDTKSDIKTNLSVNVNKVALLRNTRHLDIPSVLWSARTSIEAGAQGITVHPRPDERHIRPHDVRDIAKLLKFHPEIEFNIEGNPFLPPFMELVRATRPHQCTFVPDSPEVFTSDHGWDLTPENIEKLGPVIEECKSRGARVSLFLDADLAQLEKVPGTGAERIELYTEPYAAAYKTEKREEVFDLYAKTAARAAELNLGVNAGHDLNLENLDRFVSIPNVLEVSIGHALIADALKMGLSDAVKAYLKILNRSA